MSHSPYAAAFAEPAGSPIRELFPYLSRPGMISFAGGYPSPALLDGAGIEQAAQRVFAQGAGILQYGATEGASALREALARLCGARGIDAKPEDILVTTGSQQAFDLLVRVFVEPGDVVYVESPSYPATLQALRLAGARIEQVPVDDQGMRIDALETLLANAPADALPKLIYTVPTYSNLRHAVVPGAARAAGEPGGAARRGRGRGRSLRRAALLVHGGRADPRAGREAAVGQSGDLPVQPVQDAGAGAARRLDGGAGRSHPPLRHRQADHRPVHLADRAADRRGVPERRPLSGHGGTRPA